MSNGLHDGVFIMCGIGHICLLSRSVPFHPCVLLGCLQDRGSLPGIYTLMKMSLLPPSATFAGYQSSAEVEPHEPGCWQASLC